MNANLITAVPTFPAPTWGLMRKHDRHQYAPWRRSCTSCHPTRSLHGGASRNTPEEVRLSWESTQPLPPPPLGRDEWSSHRSTAWQHVDDRRYILLQCPLVMESRLRKLRGRGWRRLYWTWRIRVCSRGLSLVIMVIMALSRAGCLTLAAAAQEGRCGTSLCPSSGRGNNHSPLELPSTQSPCSEDIRFESDFQAAQRPVIPSLITCTRDNDLPSPPICWAR